MSPEDLLQYGVEGLMEALRRFDASRGASVRTFVHYRILGAMHDGVRKAGIGRRRSARERFHELADAYLSEASGHAAGLGRAAAMVADLAVVYAATQEGRLERVEVGPGPAEMAERSQGEQRVRAALAQLEEREKALIEACYFRDRTLTEVAKQLGVSKSWASRLHARAVSKLRRALRPTDGDATSASGPAGA